MKLATVVNEFVTLKRSMGMIYQTEGNGLAAFCRAMGDVDIKDVGPTQVLSFIVGKGPITLTWHHKYWFLVPFYRYAITRGYTDSYPLPTAIPKVDKPFQAYIYTLEELQRLLAMTPRLIAKKSRLRVDTFRALFLLICGTGLRLNEALSLTLADVDLSSNVLNVRNSKFFKSRLVPIGPRLAAELSAYAIKRRTLPCPLAQDSVFIAPRGGTQMTREYAEQTFRELCGYAGIRREGGSRNQPRWHDLRHTYAVRRLVDWYRRGADVQRLLPRLSIYLGHVSVASTQPYLSMTPELLQQASQRFERYALREVNHVG